MNEDQNAADRSPPLAIQDKAHRPTIYITLGAIALFALLLFNAAAAFEQLILGWLYFAIRVVPQMTVDVPTVFVGVLSLVGFVVLLRRWLGFMATRQSWSEQQRQQWTSWSMTLRLTCVLLLLFVSGTSIVGLAHQSIWLSTSRNADHADRGESLHVTSLSDFTGLSDAVSMQTKHELHQMSLAIHNFGDVSGGNFPAGGTLTADGRPLHGWITCLGPYLSFSTQDVDFSVPFNASPNDRLFRCGMDHVVVRGVSPEFDDEGFGLSHIAANVHLFSVVVTDGGELREVTSAIRWSDLADGGTNTLMIGEAAGDFQPWGSPWNLRDPSLGLNMSSHSFGTPLSRDFSLHAMADGSVREISHAIDQQTFRQLGSPGGNSEF